MSMPWDEGPEFSRDELVELAVERAVTSWLDTNLDRLADRIAARLSPTAGPAPDPVIAQVESDCLNAGLALVAFEDSSVADTTDVVTRSTYAVMMSFTDRAASDPVCSASHETLARRAGMSRATIMRAQKKLEELGLIKRAGHVDNDGPGRRVVWIMIGIGE